MNDMTDDQEKWLVDNNISREQWRTLQNSLFPGSNPASLVLYMNYCQARKLDPMKKPAHIVPMSVKDARTGNYEWRDVIMPGIYEYRVTAQRTGKYAGQDKVIFGPDIEFTGGALTKSTITVPEYAEVTVHRIVEGNKCSFTGMAYFTETCATKKDGKLNAMWSKRPRGQLAKCAEADALRKAFPDELGGEMTIEEMEGKEIDHASVLSTAVFSDEQYADYLKLIDGQNPLGYFVFLQSLDERQTMDIQLKYKNSVKDGKKGKEMTRLAEVLQNGRVIADAIVEAIENGTDDEATEAILELSDMEYDYVEKELSPAGLVRLQEAA